MGNKLKKQKKIWLFINPPHIWRQYAAKLLKLSVLVF
jgi:hypothetical protein